MAATCIVQHEAQQSSVRGKTVRSNHERNFLMSCSPRKIALNEYVLVLGVTPYCKA